MKGATCNMILFIFCLKGNLFLKYSLALKPNTETASLRINTKKVDQLVCYCSCKMSYSTNMLSTLRGCSMLHVTQQ